MESDCIFCKIVAGQAPAARIYEDELCLAFLDINQATYGKTLVIPKAHYQDIRDTPDEDLAHLAKVTKAIIRHIESIGLAHDFQVFNTCGELGQQSVFHLHFHIMPRTADDGADYWLPRNPADAHRMQDLAAKLRMDRRI